MVSINPWKFVSQGQRRVVTGKVGMFKDYCCPSWISGDVHELDSILPGQQTSREAVRASLHWSRGKETSGHPVGALLTNTSSGIEQQGLLLYLLLDKFVNIY